MRCRFNSTVRQLNNNGLHGSLENFIRKVNGLQNHGLRHMVQALNFAIAKYQPTIAEKLGISERVGKNDVQLSEIIWYKLLNDDKHSQIVEERQKILQLKNRLYRAPQVSYRKFIRALYPKKGQIWRDLTRTGAQISTPLSNPSNYSMINHEMVYKYYCKLPYPAPSYMMPDHFEHFLASFLPRRDFERPFRLGISNLRSKKAAKSALERMIKHRKEHIRRCTKIIADMKEAGIPLSHREQDQMIFMTFFRDRGDIQNRLCPGEEWSSREKVAVSDQQVFDWKTYQIIKTAYDSLNVDTFNTLLFLASRHEQHDIVCDILKVFRMAYLVGIDDDVPQHLDANGTTIEILLGHFSSPGFSNKYDVQTLTFFVELLNFIAKEDRIHPDIKIINSVLRGLVDLRFPNEAEYLSSKLFYNWPLDAEKVKKVRSSPHLFFYNNATFDDKIAYQQYRHCYDKLRNLLAEAQLDSSVLDYEIIPNESTFRPLLYHYCSLSVSFFKAIKFLEIMEWSFGLPLTTRLFRALYGQIASSKTLQHNFRISLTQMNQITAKLVETHDRISSNENLLTLSQIEGLPISLDLKGFLKERLSYLEPEYVVPKEKGSYLKLSDELMYLIHRSYVEVIKNSKNISADRKNHLIEAANTCRKSLLQDILSIRGRQSIYELVSEKKQTVYDNDQISYLKKDSLIELMEITLCEDSMDS